MTRPQLVCLLPARNAAADLPGWFSSVERFADAVIALDDGSTDDTAAALESHPLVQVLLRNQRRETYQGWDDAENRNRLLAAAGAFEPTWIFSLDADERLDAADADALRRFALEEPEDTSTAYALRVFRMIGDDGSWDQDHLWVGRLFAHRPGQRFPGDRLHFVPIPTDIDPSSLVRTTLRIQHLAGTTSDKRRRRHDKYAEADPDREFQSSYDSLLTEAGRLHPWADRPPDLPFELHGRADIEPVGGVGMSVVVISQNDRERIVAALEAIFSQQVDDDLEVILVSSGTDGTAQLASDSFPDLQVIQLDHPALPGEARNVGLEVASGLAVTFPGSHVRLEPGALQHRLDRHRAGWAMVSGTIVNGTATWAGWASYFLDHHHKMAGIPGGPLKMFPATASYLRRPLVHAGGFPDVRAGEDTLVNQALWQAGYGAFREPLGVTIHHSPCRSPLALLSHHRIRGTGFGHVLAAAHAEGEVLTRGGLARFGPRYLAGRLVRIARSVWRWGDAEQRRHFVLSAPLVLLGAAVHWASGWVWFLTHLRTSTTIERPR
jgi:glycosyltransferase involved in cell wall biosynthesis